MAGALSGMRCIPRMWWANEPGNAGSICVSILVREGYVDLARTPAPPRPVRTNPAPPRRHGQPHLQPNEQEHGGAVHVGDDVVTLGRSDHRRSARVTGRPRRAATRTESRVSARSPVVAGRVVRPRWGRPCSRSKQPCDEHPRRFVPHGTTGAPTRRRHPTVLARRPAKHQGRSRNSHHTSPSSPAAVTIRSAVIRYSVMARPVSAWSRPISASRTSIDRLARREPSRPKATNVSPSAPPMTKAPSASGGPGPQKPPSPRRQ